MIAGLPIAPTARLGSDHLRTAHTLVPMNAIVRPVSDPPTNAIKGSELRPAQATPCFLNQSRSLRQPTVARMLSPMQGSTKRTTPMHRTFHIL
jgi:hypothetical protein